MEKVLRTVFHTLEFAVIMLAIYLLLHFANLSSEVNFALLTLGSAAVAKYGREIGVLPDNPNVCIIKKQDETKETQALD